jgi:broad specificity phosphatase PhoE
MQAAPPISEGPLRFYERRGASPADYRPPGGESFNDLAARVLPLFEEIVHDSTGNLLIVGHAVDNRIILCHLLNLPRKIKHFPIRRTLQPRKTSFFSLPKL